MRYMFCIVFLFSSISWSAEESDLPMYTASTGDYNHQWEFTPSLSIINIPHPLNIGLEAVYGESIGIKIQKSIEPSFNVDNNKLKMDDKNLQLRKYFDGTMYFGLAYGEHTVNATRNESYNGINANIFANVKSEYLTPAIGWKWVFSNRLTLGIELGWIFPFNASSSVGSDQDLNPIVTSDPDYQNAVRDAEKAAKDLASTGIPSIGLLEVGWTF